MERTISIAEARNKLTQLPEEFAENIADGAVTVTRHGKPVLAIMPYDLFDSIKETLEVLGDPALTVALRQSIREASQGETISWDSLKAELKA